MVEALSGESVAWKDSSSPPLVPRPRQFHLHAVRLDSAFWTEHLLFCDALHAEPGIAAEYFALKEALAARFRDDRERHADAEAGFIQSVVRRAQAGAPVRSC